MKLLGQPENRYRSVPFWAINDYLDEKEIRRQVRELHRQGFGGAFFHARDGLGTPYFGEAWFRMVRAALEEGKKCGFNLWLYDEDRHPSLQHRGTVPKKDPSFCQQRIALTASIAAGETALAWYDVNENTGAVRQIPAAEQAQHKKIAIKLFSPRPFKNGWYHEAPSYVDLLNENAVKTALKLAYEPYARRFKKDFGAAIPGIFFDEPYLLDVAREASFVWTDGFEDIFRQQHGYDVTPLLPLLHYKGKGYRKLRHDYWHTVTRQFVKATTRQVCAWGDRNGLPVTGHYLCEDSLDGQITCAGAVMPHYEYMQIPGIDLLSRDARRVLTMKQVSSVASQFGRKKVMSELYALSGHGVSFAELKWIADLHLVLGVNFLVPHLTLYSMKGRRKRDCPPTLSDHQPYWKDYKYLNDYLGRCGQILSKGNPVAPTLVLHPVSTGWATYELLVEDRQVMNRYNEQLNKTLEALLTAKCSFELGDETIMARHAKITAAGIRVRKMEYASIIIPPSLTWFRSTFDLLMKFKGRIIVIGRKPTCIEGVPDRCWQAFWKKKNVTHLSRPDPETLSRLLPVELDIRDEKGRLIPRLYLHHRVNKNKHIYFLANNRLDKAVDCSIAFNGEAEELDLATGAIMAAPSTRLSPGGTRCYQVTSATVPEKILIQRPKGKTRRLTGPYTVSRTEPNLLPLDFGTVSINGGTFSARLPVFQLRNRVLKHFDLLDKQDYQPYVLDQKKIKLPRKRRINLRFSFRVKDLPESIFLALESADRYTVYINGKEIAMLPDAWLIDRSFKKTEITAEVKKGRNTIELATDYQLNTEIEDLYLAGDFGVQFIENKPVITSEPSTLKAGDWCTQGYPFYAGSLVYRKEFICMPDEGKQTLLNLEGVKASVCAVRLNGSKRRLIAWAPWQVDVTDELQTGKNLVEIEVTATLRNVMGPLHNSESSLTEYSVFPSAFEDAENWTDIYRLVPYGLTKEPVVEQFR